MESNHCPSCKQQLDDQSPTCPSCGSVLQQSQPLNKVAIRHLAALGLCAIAVGIISCLFGDTYVQFQEALLKQEQGQFSQTCKRSSWMNTPENKTCRQASRSHPATE